MDPKTRLRKLRTGTSQLENFVLDCTTTSSFPGVEELCFCYEQCQRSEPRSCRFSSSMPRLATMIRAAVLGDTLALGAASAVERRGASPLARAMSAVYFPARECTRAPSALVTT